MRFFLASASLALLPCITFAASPVGNVGTSVVDKGAFSIEQRMGYSLDNESASDNQRFQMRQHIDYGFNDWYGVRLVVSQDNRNGDSFEHGAITFENRIQLFERDEHGFDGGVRFIYGHRDGDKTPHEIDVRVMAQVPIGEKWEFRHNTVLERDIGENSVSGVALEFRNQITRKFAIGVPMIKKFQAGIEMFNDFGRLNQLSGYSDQDHQIGPIVKASLTNGSYLQTGYRLGASHGGTDHNFKLFVGHKF